MAVSQFAQREILLVEDCADDVDLTLLALSRHRVANPVTVVRDGAEALDYLFGRGSHAARQDQPPPALVLLDLRLPRVDGIEVLQQLRAAERTTLLPVVVLTSSSEERDLVDSYRLRANSYIRKPVDFLQFAEAVRQLHLYWMVLNEPPPDCC